MPAHSPTAFLEQIGVDGIADGDPINPDLLYLMDGDRIHRIDRTRDVDSIDPDPVWCDGSINRSI